jgi:flagellar biosynthesis/type III secretory pathway M-ring protein FliF/YscJ
MLILEPGVNIKMDQVKAIKNLVAYGIPRLTPDRVFVTDQNGISLTDEISRSSSATTDYRSEFEQETSAKVQKVRTMIGPGTKLAFSKQPTENTLVSTEACYRHGRTIRAIYVNLETGSYGSNKIGPTHT